MRWIRVAAILAAAAGGGAHAAQGQTPAQTPPSFRAGVEIVRLDVRATDRDGRPVRDLKQDEIQVEEDGGSRPVLLFQHIEEPRESFADAASHTIAGEVSTNQGAPRGQLYVIVFDQQHIGPGNEQRAREAAQRFLQKRVRPGDRVAAYAVPGPGPQIGFTADVRRVASELSKVRGLAQPPIIGPMAAIRVDEAYQIVRGNEMILRRVSERLEAERSSDVRPDVNASPTSPLASVVKEDSLAIVRKSDGESRRVLAILRDVMRQMRDIEGRKSMILVSEGFYDDNVRREIEEVAAAAAQSYTVIYTLDINRRGPDFTVNEPTGGDQATDILDKTTPLAGLAAETDGTFANDAGLRAEQVLDAVAAQSRDYYLVGFAPQSTAAADHDKYRRVRVRTTRSGVTISTRTGYALVDPSARLDRRQAIDRALSAPFTLQGLPVQYTTYMLRSAVAGRQRVILSLSAELPLASDEQGRSADVVFIVRSVADGRIAANGADSIALPEQRGAATTGTGMHRVQFELAPGEYIMRAVVREPGGLVGSADRRFTVPSLDGPSIAAGDLVLSSIRGELPVRPTAYNDDGLSGVLELYGRTADQLRAARVVVDLVPVAQQNAVRSGSADLQDVQSVGGGVSREARIDLPLAGVVPGPYIVRARVMVGSDTAVEVAREIGVQSGRRPAAVEAGAATAAFDPRAVVNGALARRWAAQWRATASPPAAAALKGLDRLAAADYRAAIAELQGSLAGNRSKDDEAALAFLLGWAFHGAGDEPQAITAWRRAAFVDPTIVPAHLALADVYVRLSQPALAVQALRAGLNALPGSPELLDRLSRLEQR